MATHPERPRIARVFVRLAGDEPLPEGTVWRATSAHGRSALVKLPYYEKDPGDSVLGLDAHLALLWLEGRIIAHSIKRPDNITARERQRLVRWPEAFAQLGLGDADG